MKFKPFHLLLSLSPTTLTLLSTLITSLPSIHAHPSSYATWAASSALSRHQGNGLSSPTGTPLVSYEHGELQWGLRQLYERTGNATYFDYVKAGIDNIVFENGTVHGAYVFTDYVLDPLRTGPTMIYLYNQTHQTKYKTAADTFRAQLNSHPRTSQGQFWHKLKYPNQGWLDGIYMGSVFYAEYTLAFEPQNTTAWDDITNQIVLMFNNTHQNSTAPNNTGLLYHGYDHSHVAPWASADRGHSPEVWDRAMGWYTMALIDILSLLPSTPANASNHLRILTILQTLVPKIRDAADPTTGAFWLVMTQPGRAKNYFESSACSMFVYSLLRAVRLGYVQDGDGSIVAAARKAYGYMLKTFVVDNGDGTMNWLDTVIVGSLDTTGDFNYYVSQTVDTNDLKGLAAFLLASLEFELLPPAPA